MKPYAFGVDLGGTTVKGEMLEDWEIPTRKENDGGYILSDIAETIAAKRKERGLELADVEGVGIGVPGPVSPDGVVFKCINLGWGVFNVKDRLSELTGLRAEAANDANVAALGEMWQGGGRGCRDVVMVTLGTGVGGGLVMDGKICHGFHGAAGEIGHIPMYDDDPEACGCGKHGCLEQYTSANGIVTVAKRYLAAHPEEDSALRDMEKFTAKEICDEAKKGDSAALAVVNEVCHLLGKAIAAISCVFDPQVFVIGGGMSKAGPILTEGIEKEFRHFAFHASRETKFALAELGNHAGTYGAVRMLLD